MGREEDNQVFVHGTLEGDQQDMPGNKNTRTHKDNYKMDVGKAFIQSNNNNQPQTNQTVHIVSSSMVTIFVMRPANKSHDNYNKSAVSDLYIQKKRVEL